MLTMNDRLKILADKRRKLLECGGAKRIEKQHAEGKLSARERLEVLLDPDSFSEQGLFAQHRATQFGMADKEVPADGVVTGFGSVDGRKVHVASQDFTALGGAAGEVHCDKIVTAMQGALKTGTPFVFMNDSGGARVQEGIDALGGYGRVFYQNVLMSGAVPQISIICGPCAGGAAYSPALTDFVIQTRQARMFITGPQVIKQVTGEEISQEALGGPDAHMTRAGNIHFIADDDQHAMQLCRQLLSFLPSNNLEDPPAQEFHGTVGQVPELRDLLPVESKHPYDVRQVVELILDDGYLLEVQADFAPNLVVGFGRLAGRTVGVVANQPASGAGVLDINASCKGARFIRTCNVFNIPLVNLVDIPGFLPGTTQEHGGIIRNGAKMLFAYSASTVPKLTVIMRKAYGGAYLAMCCKDLGADRVFAWPQAEIAVMGAEGAAEIIFRKEISEAEDAASKRKELTETYREAFANPYVAAARRHVDDVIDPADTRKVLVEALDLMHRKRELRPHKKHGNIPL